MSKQITGGVVDTQSGIFTAGTLCCQRYTGKAAMATGNATNNIYDYGTHVKTVLSLDLTAATCGLFAPNTATNIVFNITTLGSETGNYAYFYVTGVNQFGETLTEKITVTAPGSATVAGTVGVTAFKKIIAVKMILSQAFTANISHIYMGYGSVIGLLRTITDKYDVISWMNGTTEVARGDMTANVAALAAPNALLKANTITSTTAQAASTNVIYYYTTDREHHKVK